MALHVQVDRAGLNPVMLNSSRLSSNKFVACGVVGGHGCKPKCGGRLSLKVNASSESTSASTPALGKVTEVNKDTFWPIVEAAGDKPVVVDMYTQWLVLAKLWLPNLKKCL
ncbi:unnamed protein product [Cuscuta epithymum]|uniref:Uncharacterized protein n=1 Tax=Cuscuta epithymum TaxID=186058 RepID=A0AAV0DLZ2_9ASTE|nr:unnamed protein product [Cuscuta epithymum]